MSQPTGDYFRETGYAKLNLALHVRKRLENGYHELETVFAFLDQGDQVSVEPGEELTLSVSGPFADGLDSHTNLVLEAAQLLRKKHNINKGAKLHLEKNLPVASGIGGGSADAAATLRILNRFWALGLSQEALVALSKPLGADVPACVTSLTSFGKGVGQDLQPLTDNDLLGTNALLVNPLVAISTAIIFKKWDGIDRGSLGPGSASDALLNGRNDLQPIAATMEKTITAILFKLAETNPVMAKMSGSGATCFAIYETVELMHEAKDILEASFDRIWTMTGKLR